MREYLKSLREKNELSQQNVADPLGISRQDYQQIESGERQRDMDASIIVQLARAFRVMPGDILQAEQVFRQAVEELSASLS